MTWNRLATRLGTLPRVLAGPMLRKVTSTSVTVWFALRVPAKLTVRVWAGAQQIFSGEGTTCAVGRHLHIVAVTAVPLGATALVEGAIYRYDAVFDFTNGESGVLLPAATGNAALSYGSLGMPSFSLPPRDLNRLRLLQGSCRRPYSGSRDMLPYLDGLIGATANHPFDRPHQLLLTGDQIYADDVSDPLRMLVTDAADALMGWDELLPMPPHFGDPLAARDIHGPLRWAALKVVGFTSEDLRSHLMSLGEYLCMYLLVWSPVLWPTLLPQGQWRQQGAPGMPAVDDVRDEIRANAPDVFERLVAAREFGLRSDFKKATFKAAKNTDWIGDTLFQLALFQSQLVEVRRALANVPTYMIFDDHEVTDDWNMTPSFCDHVYGSPLGIQMIQNGLVAFGLCQHWGNVPELFKITPGMPAGARLLDLMDTADPTNPASYANKAAQYAGAAANLRRVLAIHDAATLRNSTNRAVFHDDDALRYDFTVEGDGHQVIFTDTRTWRAFPPDPPTQTLRFSGDQGTHLLSKHALTDQFKTQIVDTPALNDRLLFVVLTTNAPPTQGIRSAERHSTLTHTFDSENADLYEAWDLPSENFDRLLTALTSKLPLDGTGNHRGTVVILSGDVHHSFASRIGYRATQRYEDDTTPRRGAAATIVQLVGSGLKNVADGTIGLHEEGYFYRPIVGLGNFIRQSFTEAYVGFSFPPDSAPQNVGTCEAGQIPDFPISVRRQTIDVSEGDAPWDRVRPRSVALTVRPHYRYRLDYLVPQDTTPTVARPQLHLPPNTDDRGERARLLAEFAKAAKRDRRVNPQHCVGVGNLCELVIVGSPQPATIRHRVYWWDEYTQGVRTTTYVVPAGVTAPDDPVYPDLPAAVEPP